LEDYEEEGVVNIEQLGEAIRGVIDNSSKEEVEDIIHFIEYLVFTRGGGEGTQQMRYGVLFELLDGRMSTAVGGSMGPASLGTSTDSKKQTIGGGRPESSSPEKLKARNKEKYSQ
jgi:hypothetical protein